ncbi:MAG: HAD family hydrolase [Erysipelotrichaceae bacterium]|uniref:HAD family hydrolase n=1 Tax=Floccifex sp. TaxID=2815810 RepID=UPI002A7545EF|nr:HAD family hydrolase [Floccifex sp.]MDD7281876.1 HAD family hydrolase [Erysipelotrichaceae bacterium]MDY2958119.1 HAD family hydrolase [Floccifex sp.]
MFDTILFDLDGTLLPMDQEKFTKAYFSLMAKKMAGHGYKAEDLIQNIWKGTKGMILNDGSLSNEEVFWSVFCEFYGQKARDDEPVFEEFYKTDFQQARSSCGFNPKSKEVIDELKQKYPLILATNPIFPRIATYSRIAWAGLDVNDFKHITTYENSHSCKPNLIYYQEIIDLFNLDPSKCLMIGNDATEDMVSEQLGFNVFLLTDDLINTKNVDISKYPQGSFDDLLAYIHAQEE